MKNLSIALLGISLGLFSHHSHAAVFEILELGKSLYDVRKAQVQEARGTNMNASFFSSGKQQCIEPVGSVSIVEPEQAYWLSHLPSPTRILRKVIDDSKCFTIVDRGLGFNAVQRERDLALAGQLNNAESINRSKLRGADYVLVPGIIIENANAGGNSIQLAGEANDLVGNAAQGSFNYESKDKKAEVILTLMDVRSAEQVLSIVGEAKVSDKQYSFLLLGQSAQAKGQAGIGGWGNTGMDEVLRDAYADAYKRMIAEIGNKNLISRLDKNSGEVSGNAEKVVKTSIMGHLVNQQLAANEKMMENRKKWGEKLFGKQDAEQTDGRFTLTRLANLYQQADIESSVIVELKKGIQVYTLGEEQNNMLKVQNELGKTGWIAKIHLQAD